MSNKQEIIELLDNEAKFRKKLFCRGYLITNTYVDDTAYPFYSEWNKYNIRDYTFLIHEQQHFYYVEKNGITYFLIGACINPFSMEIYEEQILEKLEINSEMEYLNQLTGNFLVGTIDNEKIKFLTDPTEMLFCSYAKINNDIYISSHVQLIADICNLEKSEFIKKFEKYRFFYKYGLSFPGNDTQFEEVKRAMPNHIYSYDKEISFRRFYPTKKLELCKTEEDYSKLINDVSQILKNTMKCISMKWSRPAISLTGGMDSKTTLAAANGIYDSFHLYSYETMKGDIIDSKAAHKIASYIGEKHKIYSVSDNDDDFKDYDSLKKILLHNNGDYKVNDNDIRKRLFFDENNDFDIEVKSWVSEIARANYYKKFGTKKMPEPLKARHMSSIYKIFGVERKLLKEVDNRFKKFISESGFDSFPKGYDNSDMFLWEFRYAAWGGMVITSEHSYSNEIFIPYNNRLLLNMMLQSPTDKRISDEFHEDLIRFNNSKIDEVGITITNWNETKKRMYLEKIYFNINSILPF